MKKFIRCIGLGAVLLTATAWHAANAQEAERQTIEYLEFREVDIKDVLRQLAKQYNLNIVFSESVKGLVTVQLANVSVEQAMDSVITVNGFAYNKKENVYKVTTQEEARREGKQSKLFKLNNADSGSLKDTLAKVLSGDGSCQSDSRSNSLLVTDSIAVINKIEGIIAGLDEPTLQVLIETKFIETSLTNTEKLGIDWTTTVSASGSKRPTTFPFNKWGNDSKFYPAPKQTTTQTYVEDQSSWISNPNYVPGGDQDPLIHPFIPQNTTVSEFPYGTNYALSSLNLPAVFGAFPEAAASYFAFGTLDLTSLKAVFDFLKERQNTKLVANPRVVTLNNLKATINVGKVLSLPKYERNQTTGNMEITGWISQPVGVTLEVTPQISPDGHIRMKLKPEVSSLVGYASTRNGVNEGPITSSRTVDTEVQISDGQTVVIGGLVKEDTLKHEKKIPILGDIPILGYLFKREEVGSADNPSEKTDLLIFVTARIIKDNKQMIAKAGQSPASSNPQFKLKLREIKNYRIE